ncbi:NADH dehydrogenase/oxidoreductase-like protein [Salinarchaeum sp. Harcht-Bsk1]|uniref:complex I NDUFA9 subunit family protein n=1 Tax=Salinarchaeum sp. Harcht-Bsk1 TaxID=1333523 RepID=UPI000342385E|nr:complex I NDUFA9 subunit family protein [Salinarchaeum sp. Harcht-Bsk1]AGM99977.1 NADH dehydrogenase/oxidoreductase-like protein [Salinarchaeum sp. Harcht-Bsk1]
MEVLVTGGTGFIGSALAAELRDRDHDVTVLARDPDGDGVPDGVMSAAGDVTDYDSIEPAFEGMDAVVNLVALSPLFKTPSGLSHESVHLGGTKHVLDAATEHDLDRIVQMSALGADSDGPTEYLRTKGEAESAVRDATIDHVIVRPSIVFGDGAELVPFTKRAKQMFAPGLPIAPLPGGGKTRFQPIYIGDLVPMLADCVEGDDHANSTYEFGGPEVLTLAELTRLVYRAEGKTMRVVPIPMPVAGLGLAVLGTVPPFPFNSEQYRSLRVDNTVSENDVTAFGRSPDELVTFEEYLGIDN